MIQSCNLTKGTEDTVEGTTTLGREELPQREISTLVLRVVVA